MHAVVINSTDNINKAVQTRLKKSTSIYRKIFSVLDDIKKIMMRYLFTAIGFALRGSGQPTCTKIGKREHTRRNNTQNNTKTQNTQNRKQTYKTKNKHTRWFKYDRD